MKLPAFIRNWDEGQKASAVRLLGFFLAAVAVFALIAEISFLFSWKQDMSLAPGEDAANAAGSLGYRTGRLLIAELFGLGSLVLPVLLAIPALRLISGRWISPFRRILPLALSGAFVLSLILAFAGSAAGFGTLFGNGLGGACGALVCNWSVKALGAIPTILLLLILTALWLTFASKGFSRWFASLWTKGGETAEPSDSFQPDHTPEEAPRKPRHAFAAHRVNPGNTEGNASGEENPEGAAPAATPAAGTDEGNAPSANGEEEGVDAPMEVQYGEGLDTTTRQELSPINIRLDPPDGLPGFNFPPSLELLKSHDSGRHEVGEDELMRNRNKIKAALANYKIQIIDVKAIVGPTVTLYKVYPAPGVRINDIKRLQDDIAMSLKAKGVRVVALEDSVGIEVANDFASIVPLKAMFNDDAFRESKAELPVAIGYTITQKVKVFDLADAPHLLIAGATKQGKSVGLNVIVSSLLYSKHPSELKFVFIDPKMVEFSAYARLLHHYLAVLPDSTDDEDEMANAIVKKPKDAEKILRSLCIEMDARYELMSKSGVNKLSLYNEKFCSHHLRSDQGHRFLPYLVVIVDEYADLTMTGGAGPEAKAAGKSITTSIIRLAQKGRAAGIHVILATQRPSVDVISGPIKANFPVRIAFRVAARVDSMTILDAPGAEKLIGRGDMLLSAGIDSERIQCAYVGNDEIDAITTGIAAQSGYSKSYNTPYYLPDVGEGEDGESSGGGGELGDLDERFKEAAELVVTTQKASTSYLQTRLGMGFAKAARVMGQLETAGVVGPQDGAKPRQVLVGDLNSLYELISGLSSK